MVIASGTRGERVTVWGFTDDGLAPISRYVAHVLRQLGYPTRVRVLSHDQLDALGAGGLSRIQIVFGSWTADYPSAYGFFGPWLTCRGAMDHNYFCRPNLDRQILAAAALGTTDAQQAGTRWGRSTGRSSTKPRGFHL